MNNPIIKLRGLSKHYKNKIAVDNLSLEINKGEIHGIIGYSGAGKSTLVRCINLLERPTSGRVIFKGEDLTSLPERELRLRRKKIGMIFQHFNLMPLRDVYGNIAYPLHGSGLSKEEQKKKVNELLELVGLRDKEKAYPSQLSGGQKQRVAIARALANDPEILLCDEATSALDPKTTKSILKLLKDLRDKLGLTIILITHEMEVIKEICDSVSVMEDGYLVEQGEVIKIFSNPKNGATKEFLQTTSNIVKMKELLELEKNIFNIGSGDVLVRVQYVGESAKEAILSQASRKFGINISVLFGNFDILEHTPLGELIVLFSGPGDKISEGLDYFREKGLQIEIIENKKGAI